MFLAVDSFSARHFGKRIGSSGKLQIRTVARRASLLLVATLLLAPAAAHAATETWTGGGADANWMTAGNWSGTNLPPIAGDILSFGISSVTALNNDYAAGTSFGGFTFTTGANAYTIGGNGVALTGALTDNVGSASTTETINLAIAGTSASSLVFGSDGSGGNNLALGASDTFGSMSVLSNVATANALNIGANTLTITGAFAMGAGTVANAGLTVTGNGGTLNFTNTASDFIIGGSSAGTVTCTMDMSALSNLIYSTGATGTGNFRVAYNSACATTMTMASVTNSITAATFSVGDSNGKNGRTTTLHLNGTTTVNAGTITWGNSKGTGNVDFLGTAPVGSAASPTLRVRGQNGTARPTWNLGTGTSGSGAGNTTANLTGHYIDLLGGTMSLATHNGSGTGSNSAVLSFDDGIVDVTTLNLANRSGTGTGSATATVNVGGSTTTTATLNIGTGGINFAGNADAATGTSTGTLDVKTGGLVQAGGNLLKTTATGVANLILEGGTLDLQSHSIGTTAIPFDNVTFPIVNQTATLANIGGTGVTTLSNAAGGLNMNGTGSLILAGTNNFTGGTTVSSGTLRVNGTLAGTTDVTGGTAGGIGTYGDVTLDGGIFTAASPTTTGAVTASSLTINSGNVQFKFGGSSSDQINITGATNLSNSQITIGQISRVTSGSYQVLTAGGPLSNVTPGLLTTVGRTSYSIDGPALTAHPNQIQIDVVGSPAALKWTGADNAHSPAEWDNIQSDANWQRTDGGTSDPTHFYDADSVTFDGTNTGPSNLTISGTVTPSSIAVTAGTYSFNSFGSIAGSGPLTVSGTGNLTLNVSNTNFSGAVTISGGTITANSFAALGTGPVTLSAGTLNFGHPSAMGSALFTITGGNLDNTSGGAMTLAGNQPIALNGSFTFLGAADGSHDLSLGIGPVALGAANSTITVNAGTLTIGGTISGVGSGLTMAGGGTLVLDNTLLANNADNTFSGGVTINSGTVQVNRKTSGKTPLGSGATIVNAGGTLVGGNADAFGFTAGFSPATIFINGGTVTDLPGGIYRLTLRDINFTGGTLTSDPTNAGDGNGNYSLNGGTVESNAAATTAVISAGTVALQNGSASGQTTFTVAAGNVTTGPTPGVDLLVSSTLKNWNTLVDGINKDGPGVMSLSGSNSYSGPTVVRGGTLRLVNSTSNNNVASSSAITVNSGATLDVSGITATGGFMLSSPQTLSNAGTVVGAVDVPTGTVASGTGTYGDIILDGGTFRAGSATTIGTVSAGNLTVNSGQVPFKFGGSSADRINLSGGSNLTNSEIAITQLAVPNPGSYLVLTAASPLAGITPGTLLTQGRISYTIDGPAFTANPDQILIDVVGGPATLKWTGADAANDPTRWNNIQTDANWQRTDAGTSDPTHFYDGDNVVFDGTNTGPSNLNINGTVSPASITVSAGTYVFGGSGTIAGNGPLSIASGASLTTATIGSGTIMANGTLVFNNASDITLSNTVSGTGAIHVAGTANVILAASNDFSGTYVLDSGTLQTNIAGALGNGTPPASILFSPNVPAGTTLNLNGISSTISGLNSDPANPGGATVDNSGAAAATLTVSSAATNTFSGVLENTGASLGLTVTGGGTLVLSGVNTFTGKTIITGASTVQTASAANLVDLTGQVQFNNGTLHITADPNNPGAIVYAATLSNKFTTSGNGGATGTFNIDAGVTFQTQDSNATQTTTTPALQTAGSGTAGSSFTKTGAGTMIIYGQNNQQDTSFKLVQGTIDLRSARGLGGQDTNGVRLDMSDGTTLILDNDSGFTNPATTPAAVTGTDFLTGLRAATAGGTINVTVDEIDPGVAITHAFGAIQAAGAFTMNVTSGPNMTSGTAGLYIDQNSSQTGGGFNGAVALSGDGTFNVMNNATTGVAMQMTINGPVTGAFGLIKNGTGSLTLNAASTYTGATTVNNGTLRTASAGTISTGPLVINAAAGVSSIVSLANSQSVQSLTVSTDPTGSARIDVAPSSTLTVDPAGATSLQGNLNKTGDGNLLISGTLSIADHAAVQVNGGTLRISLASGPATVGAGTSVAVNNAGVLELAGSVAALSDGTAAHSSAIVNNSTAAAGLHVTGTNQRVGTIDGSGTTQVEAGADLTASHIVQSALVIGGTAGSPALVTIAASDASGNSLASSSASAFGRLASSSSSSLTVGGSASSAPPIVAAPLSLGSGGPLAAGSRTSVPEPSSILLLLAAAASAALAVGRIRRR